MTNQPLAASLRPTNLSEVIGQDHLVAEGGALAKLLDGNGALAQSIILYGPPGCGKTTIARLVSGQAVFIELSALNSGVAELRDTIEAAAKRLLTFDQRTCLFVDELHRFAKNQQEALLAAVESGTVTLIGATTELPSVSVVRALLSRCLVFELNSLSDEAVSQICHRAIRDFPSGRRLQFDSEALQNLVRFAAGDARKALNLLEAAVKRMHPDEVEIHQAHLDDVGTAEVLDFDLGGDFHYDTISAFIKSVRGSDVDAALEYLAVMLVGGERPEFVARRLMILAAEDVGLADPSAVSIVFAATQIAQQVGMPEARIPLAEATIYLALAPKSNSAYRAINSAMQRVKDSRPQIPNHLTRAGSDRYVYPHDFDPPITRQQYVSPPAVVHYQPKASGFERNLVDRLAQINEILGKPKD